MKRARSFLALIFSILSLLLLTACSNRQESSSRAGNASAAANANIALNANATALPPSPSPKVNPERLIDIISQLQVEYVRESFGLESGQCFTDVDFKTFMHEKTTDKIVEGLRRDQDFIAVVNAIRDMNTEHRSALLNRARRHYKSTWAELGLDPRTTSANELRRGQTDAGQQAEKLIAQAVVDLVRQMI